MNTRYNGSFLTCWKRSSSALPIIFNRIVQMASLASKETGDGVEVSSSSTTGLPSAEASFSSLKHLTRKDKIVLLNTFTISVARVVWDEIDRQWSKFILLQICGYLDLDDMSFSAVEPLLQPREDGKQLSPKAFLSSLPGEKVKPCCEKFVFGVLNILIQSEQGYDSRMRQSIIFFCIETEISEEFLYNTEKRVSQVLQSAIDTSKSEAVAKTKKKEEEKSYSIWKKMAVGAGAVAGGTALILTGGLAAPALAAGFSALGNVAVVGGASAAIGGFVASSGGAVLMTTMFGVTGAGLGGYKINKRLGGLNSFEIREVVYGSLGKEERGAILEDSKKSTSAEPKKTVSLTITILVNGWAYPDAPAPLNVGGEGSDSSSAQEKNEAGCFSQKKREEIFKRNIGESNEGYIVDFELEDLKALHDSLQTFVKKEVITYAGTTALQNTVLGAIMASVALPAYIIKAADVIDNPYGIACSKAVQAGHALANLLLNREAGSRPVQLFSFSLGCLTLLSCVEKLAAAGKKGRGIVNNLVFLGAPFPNTETTWKTCRSVCSGRIVNCFSRKDSVLKFLSRVTLQASFAAGIGATTRDHEKMFRIENRDVDKFGVEGCQFMSYAKHWHEILQGVLKL
jgi:hypothetical protein